MVPKKIILEFYVNFVKNYRVTKISREVAALGREMMGGNGIYFDNYSFFFRKKIIFEILKCFYYAWFPVLKAMADLEVMFTGEGSYEVCVLVCGRELTGVSAF